MTATARGKCVLLWARMGGAGLVLICHTDKTLPVDKVGLFSAPASNGKKSGMDRYHPELCTSGSQLCRPFPATHGGGCFGKHC